RQAAILQIFQPRPVALGKRIPAATAPAAAASLKSLELSFEPLMPSVDEHTISPLGRKLGAPSADFMGAKGAVELTVCPDSPSPPVRGRGVGVRAPTPLP